MSTLTEDPVVRPDAEPPPAHHARGRRPDWTAVVAAGVWLVGTVIAMTATSVLHISGNGIRGWSLPLGYGFAGCAVILAIFALLRRAPDWLAGASAGFFGSWVTLVLGTAIGGTPFPFQGLVGDSSRLTAMATRYSVTWESSDAFIRGLPSEYPPLFPWLVGRTAAVLNTPAWRLVGHFEVLWLGLAILLGFLLWRRLLPSWVALITTVVAFYWSAIPNKAYESLTLLVFLPWALATFGRPPRGRLHWLTAGIIAGLLVQTYFGWIVFASFGLIAIAFMTWRSETNRKAYLIYLVKVIITAAVVASWFLIPYLYGSITIGGRAVGDLYGASNFLDLLFPFVGATPMAVLQLIGLIGMVFLRRSTWWATPLLTIVAGAYLFRIFGTLLFALTQHTLLVQYTPGVYGAAMTVAGVLTFVHATPKLLDRLRIDSPAGGVAIAMSITLAFIGFNFTMDWMPNAGGRYADYTERAYAEPLPDGTYVINKPADQLTKWFPVTPVQQAVQQVRGSDQNMVVLSTDERLFSFLPWHGYTYTDSGGSTAHWFERLAELRKLEATKDPTAFAAGAAHTAYGPIDVFVLQKKDGAWQWDGHVGFNQPEALVNFQPAQFDRSDWVVNDLPNDYVIAIRKPS
jgi:Arabinofuranosyltransferase N terminal/Arabinofuranosyltransferase A C terminal